MEYIPPDTMVSVHILPNIKVTYPRIWSASIGETDFANKKSTKAGLQSFAAAIVSKLYPVNLTLLILDQIEGSGNSGSTHQS
jgi:hypothetical protein